MRTCTQLLKVLLVILLLLFAGSSQAGPRPGFGFGAYIGMTMEEVAATYRANLNARAWTAHPASQSGGHTSQLVMWYYSDAPGNHMAFILRDGHVITVVNTEVDESGRNFRLIESLLNRNLVALDDHRWIDKASQSMFLLTQKDGSYSIGIFKLGTFKDSPKL